MGPVDVRIGVTYSPREIDLQLPDDTDRKKLQNEITKTLGATVRFCGSPTSGEGSWACRRPRWPTSSWAPTPTADRSGSRPERTPRPPGSAGSSAALRDRQGRRRQDLGRLGAGGAGRRSRQAHPGVRGRRQGEPRRLLRAGPSHVLRRRGPPGTHRDVDGHGGVAEGVPEPAPQAPAAGPLGAAGADLRLRGQRRPRREGDPDRREADLRGRARTTSTSWWSTPPPPGTWLASWAPPWPSTSSCGWAWCATRPTG